MQQRSIPMCIVLTIITCGIYGIYWFVVLNDDVNDATRFPGTSGGAAFLLSLVTCGIYGIYWSYKMGERLETLRAQRGEAPGSLPVLYLLLTLFGFLIITEALMQNELNKNAGAL